MPRPSKTQSLGDIEVTCTALAPRSALRLLARLAKVIGPLVAECFSIGGLRDGRGGIVPWAAIETVPDILDEVASQIVEHLAKLDPDDMAELAADLLCGHCRVGRISIPSRDKAGAEDVIDDVVPDVWTLIGACRVALDVNFRPTSAGAPGEG